MKNIIIKETTWFNDNPEEKSICILRFPMDAYGTSSSYNITGFSEKQIKKVIEKGFVFNPKAKMQFLQNYYMKGTFQRSDAHYRDFNLIREWIETDREETKHEYNDWESKVKTTVKWKKLNDEIN